ncbi:MAG TPA: FAD-binding protein [Sandaracinaceae bacterium]
MLSTDEGVRRLAPLRGDERGVRIGGTTRPWDEETDVAIVGFGAAGASAAIEARTAGARVLVADRFGGGGASKLSAGVVYFGGGTRLQKESGWEDSPEQMYAYLALEAADAVSEETLRAFCERSVENFEWLCAMGVPFPASGEALKTSYPPDHCTLYFSGNELCPPYCDAARPAPRGHRALGKGLTGHLIFGGLARTALQAGITLRTRTRAERLVTDDGGDVLGVELAEVAAPLAPLHELGKLLVTYGGGFSIKATEVLSRELSRFEERVVRRRFVRAKGGVVLAAGGFVFNPAMMREHAPAYASASMRLGTAGDDGRGILLGRAAGAAIARMDRCCAWRFINPPSAWTRGILLGEDGVRLCNEELYGSKIGEHLAAAGGRGWLVIDAAMMELARAQMRTEPMGGFQLVFGAANNYFNHVKADSLDALADACGLSRERLRASVAEYNAGCAAKKDALGKSESALHPIERPPFYAIDCDLDTVAFPTPCITLGGLVVDGLSARVVREDGGAPIGGLYAAGRNAVGVSSHSYVSGLSVADGIFSGRNAGAAAAARARAVSEASRPSFAAVHA